MSRIVTGDATADWIGLSASLSASLIGVAGAREPNTGVAGAEDPNILGGMLCGVLVGVLADDVRS